MFPGKLNLKAICFFVVGIMIVQQAWLNCLFAGENPVTKSRIKIIVKEVNAVKGNHVFLGDISVIQANGFLKEALLKIPLGASPKPGKIKLFDKKKIVSVLQRQRYLPENIFITSPQRIYVKRLGQTISKQDVRQFVDRQLSQVFKDKEYQLTGFSVRGLEFYPQGNIQFRFDSDEIINKNGKLYCSIDLIIDGKKEDRLILSGAVAVYENVLYAKRNLRKGEIISRESVYRKKKNIYELDVNFIQTFDDIGGKVLKSGIRKGDYLKSDLLAKLPLVEKGDIITLVVKNENLLIVTSGISRENGFKDELIKVENINSGKLIRGIIKGKSKVEVVY